MAPAPTAIAVATPRTSAVDLRRTDESSAREAKCELGASNVSAFGPSGGGIVCEEIPPSCRVELDGGCPFGGVIDCDSGDVRSFE